MLTVLLLNSRRMNGAEKEFPEYCSSCLADPQLARVRASGVKLKSTSRTQSSFTKLRSLLISSIDTERILSSYSIGV